MVTVLDALVPRSRAMYPLSTAADGQIERLMADHALEESVHWEARSSRSVLGTDFVRHGVVMAFVYGCGEEIGGEPRPSQSRQKKSSTAYFATTPSHPLAQVLSIPSFRPRYNATQSFQYA